MPEFSSKEKITTPVKTWTLGVQPEVGISLTEVSQPKTYEVHGRTLFDKLYLHPFPSTAR